MSTCCCHRHHRSRRGQHPAPPRAGRLRADGEQASISSSQVWRRGPYPSGPLPCRDHHCSLPQRASRRSGHRGRLGPRAARRRRGRRPASTRLLDEADERADAFAERYAGQRRRARRRRARRGDARARRDLTSSSAAPATTPALRFSADTADPANGALLQRVQERGTAIETTLLFFDLEWAALDDERAEELLADRGARLLPPPPAHAAPLPPAPADRARGEDPDREGGHRARRLGAAVRRADVGDRGRPADGEASRCRSTSRWRACSRPTATVRRARRRGGHRGARSRACARAPSSSTRCSHDKAVDDRLRRYPHWLAAPQPRQRGHATSRCRRWSRRCAAATTSRSAGTGSRRSCSASTGSPTTTAMAPVDRRRRASVAWARGARARARLLRRRSRRELGDVARRFFDERWIDAPVRPGKRGGAFCAYAVPSRAPVRAAQLHRPAPRRADARPRARPRRARDARRARRASSTRARR